MSFSVEYDIAAIKFLKQLDKHLVDRILTKIEKTLPLNPVPHDAKTIVGKHGVFRIRIGDYRVLYRINYETGKIIVVTIDKRSRVYNWRVAQATFRDRDNCEEKRRSMNIVVCKNLYSISF